MKIFIAILIILAVFGAVWFYFIQPNLIIGIPLGEIPPRNKVNLSPTPMPTPTPTPTGVSGAIPKTVKVEMTSAGFSPKEISINIGDAVQFINKDIRDWWPASGVHPTHQVCPGLDALKDIKPGDSYSHTFSTAATCPMHDHLKPSFFGKIIVK